MERVVSFSVKPIDKKSQEEIKRLRDYSTRTGISFSYLMIQAVKLVNKELLK